MRHLCLLSPDVFLECDVLGVEAAAQAEEDQRGPGLRAGLGRAHGGEEAGGGRGLALGVPGGHGDQVAGVALQGPRHIPGQWSASDNAEQTGGTYAPMGRLAGLRYLLDRVVCWLCSGLCDVQVVKQTEIKVLCF